MPRLRFPKFTDDWEQREFDKVFLSFPNKNYQLQSTEYYESGKFPIIDQGKKAIIGYSDNKSKVCNKYPSIIFGDHTTELKYVDFPFIVGADGVKTLSVKDGDTLFQYYNLQVNNVQPTGYNRHFSMLKEISLCVPCLAEQRQIGTYFRNLDTLITLHQRKCDKLEEYKKAMLQKIFSQELRFKREDGTDYSEWSNKRFANAFTPLNNNTFSRDMLSENGTVLNIHYGDILVRFGEVCDIQTMDIPKVNTDIDTSRFDELQNGDIVLADTAEDETVGKAIEIYHVGTSKVVSGLHTMACRPTDKYAPKYMGYYINSPTYHNQLLPFMQGIKVTSISRRNIADTVVYYPYDIEEQQKIADFLSALDEAISYAKQELDKWKELKKGLLQQMFV